MTLRMLVTGASSGIGRATAHALADRGCRLVLTGRDAEALSATADEVKRRGTSARFLVGDLTDAAARDAIRDGALEAFAGLDGVVHVAGVNAFTPFESQSAASVERTFAVNTLAPMLLTQSLLPHFRARGDGRIAFVGSIFGSIAFPWFATYSASKAAVRGFAEALRRELAGTGISVTYVAPRGTRTPMSNDFAAMARAVGMTLDEPDHVGERIAQAVLDRRRDVHLGFPEALFVRVNAVLPGLVDGALAKKSQAMKPYALGGAAATTAEAVPPLKGVRP